MKQMKQNNKDSLGDRMKDYYESRTRLFLPRKSYYIIRIDGKAFHTYTKGLKRPFDDDFIYDMDETAKFLCKNIQGAKLAFVQSDEISIICTDFDNLQTSAWFDGNIQKISSISASLATAKFNQLRTSRNVNENSKLAMFDSRVFTISSYIEVVNYLIWRQQDTTRNSIQSLGQSLFSHKQLENKNCNQIQDMCFLEKLINWNDLPIKYKRGRLIIKQSIIKNDANRSVWESIDPDIFTIDNETLLHNIPKLH